MALSYTHKDNDMRFGRYLTTGAAFALNTASAATLRHLGAGDGSGSGSDDDSSSAAAFGGGGAVGVLLLCICGCCYVLKAKMAVLMTNNTRPRNEAVIEPAVEMSATVVMPAQAHIEQPIENKPEIA